MIQVSLDQVKICHLVVCLIHLCTILILKATNVLQIAKLVENNIKIYTGTKTIAKKIQMVKK